MYENSQVVVTGAAGFIPSHLCDALLELGATVVGVDNFISGRPQNIAHLQNHPRFTFFEADVVQPTATILPGWLKPTHIFHMASPASPVGYQRHPVETYLVNSLGTHFLLDYIRTFSPQTKFLFASTSEVYGDPTVHPQTEEYWGNVNPNGVRSCYDEAKRLGETICGVHFRSFNGDVRIVRIFNTYGPRMDKDDGRIVPQFISQAIHNAPLSIYGDGTQTRSLCYVSDLVRGLLRLGDQENARGKTINLGNPDERSVNELAHTICTLTNSTSKMQHFPLPQDDPKQRCPDISKAAQLLNWKPEVQLEDGLRKTIAYFKTQ